MTITKINNRWYDENNNSWLSEEAATQYSPTLTNCRDCRGCSNCDDCSYCDDCSNCSGCSTCGGCINCSVCSVCSDCSSCNDCSDCKKCYKCDNGTHLEPVQIKTEVMIRPELDINDRKLEPDL